MPLVSCSGIDRKVEIYFEAEDAQYLVAHAPTANDQINVYLTRLSG